MTRITYNSNVFIPTYIDITVAPPDPKSDRYLDSFSLTPLPPTFPFHIIIFR